jgi:hypothetical protein
VQDQRRTRRRLRVSFRRAGICTIWRLGFRQSSFHHIARVPRRTAPDTWTRPPVSCHALFPLTFRRQVRHQTQGLPSNPSRLSRGYDEAPRGAPLICRRQGLPDCHGAGTSVRGCMPHGSVILTAKLIAGHDAEGERRESRPGRSGCRRCPRSGSGFGDGHQPRVIQRAGPGGRPCPGTPRRRAATAQAARAQEDAAARSVHLPIPASR